MKSIISKSAGFNVGRFYRIAVVGTAVLVFNFILGWPVSSQPSLSQLTTPLEELTETTLLNNASSDAEIASSDVYLDGRRLFSVTAPVESESSEGESELSPIRERVLTIESTLKSIVRDGIDPENLSVVSTIDSRTGLPSIQVNGQLLMTITSTDRQYRGPAYSNLTKIIEEALLLAYRERQSEVLLRRAILAGGIVIVASALIFSLKRVQRRIKQNHLHYLESLESDLAETENLSSAEINERKASNEIDDIDPERSESERNSNDVAEATHHQHYQSITRAEFRYDVVKLSLKLGQGIVYVSAALGIFSLFPYTRWLKVAAIKSFSGPFVTLLFIAGTTYFLIRLSNVVIDQIFGSISEGRFLMSGPSPRLLQRLQTFKGVVKGAVFVGIVGVGALVGLATVGVNVAPILAGAGIFGLAVSFGSQSLVKDIINGFFILLEDQFGIGDVISIGDSSGFVEQMNLRITQLRSADGNLITIPNGSISVVENLTNHWSRVNMGLEVAYSTDLDQAIEVIGDVAKSMSKEEYWRDLILEEPQVLGVDGFEANSIIIRLWIKTLPLRHFEVGREYRRRIKQAFDREGISIPFPQQSIWFENALKPADSYSSQLLSDNNHKTSESLDEN